MAGRKPKKPVNKDAWLATYGDMITLILVFFVLLYSMSTLDQEKYRLLVKAFSANPETLEQIALEESLEKGEYMDTKPGAQTGAGEFEHTVGGNDAEKQVEDLQELYEYLKQYVEQNQLQDSMQVAQGDDMVYIRFMSTLFFEPDRAVLKSGGTDILDKVGIALHDVEPTVAVIRIDGHTAESSGSIIDDRDLSTERANVVLKYLERNYIEDSSKLVAGGYGRYRPIAPNDTEENMAQNRRVEILISKSDQLKEELDKIYEKDKEANEKEVTDSKSKE